MQSRWLIPEREYTRSNPSINTPVQLQSFNPEGEYPPPSESRYNLRSKLLKNQVRTEVFISDSTCERMPVLAFMMSQSQLTPIIKSLKSKEETVVLLQVDTETTRNTFQRTGNSLTADYIRPTTGQFRKYYVKYSATTETQVCRLHSSLMTRSASSCDVAVSSSGGVN